VKADDNLKRIEYLERRADTLQTKVNESARIAESLRESERHYRYLFDANPLPMWMYDLETLRFLAVNDAAVEHYGYLRTRFLAMTIVNIRPEPDVSQLHENLKQTQTGIERSGTWHHTKSDGSVSLARVVATATGLNCSNEQGQISELIRIPSRRSMTLRLPLAA